MLCRADHRADVAPEPHRFELELEELPIGTLDDGYAVTRGPEPEQGTGPAQVDHVHGIGTEEKGQSGDQVCEVDLTVGQDTEVPVGLWAVITASS